LALVAWRTRCSCSLCNSQGALDVRAKCSLSSGGENGRGPGRTCSIASAEPPRPVSPENGTEEPGYHRPPMWRQMPTTHGF